MKIAKQIKVTIVNENNESNKPRKKKDSTNNKLDNEKNYNKSSKPILRNLKNKQQNIWNFKGKLIKNITHTYLSSEPEQSPFANLEPPRNTFTHLFRDELGSFWFEVETGVKGWRTKMHKFWGQMMKKYPAILAVIFLFLELVLFQKISIPSAIPH